MPPMPPPGIAGIFSFSGISVTRAWVIRTMPATLAALIERSQKLHLQVRRLDSNIHNSIPADQAPSINPVEHQRGLLKAAFGVE